MADLRVNRTLVKSPPELWMQVSDVESLARHLGEFGEIAITRLEPEHTVAWEGENARGTVELEASGWGTKVTLSAALDEATELAPQVGEAVESAELPEEASAAPAERRSWLRRLFRRRRSEILIGEHEATTAELDAYLPEPPAWYEPDDPEVAAVIGHGDENTKPVVDPERANQAFEDALDALGAAHHRPFSRG